MTARLIDAGYVVEVRLPSQCKAGVPRGIRTPVTAVKGRCPGPLDDGDAESIGGARRDRTVDLLHAMQALSQLSYGPTRGAATYGSVSGMSSKQKRLHHIGGILWPCTCSPNPVIPSPPVSAAGDSLCSQHLVDLLVRRAKAYPSRGGDAKLPV